MLEIQVEVLVKTCEELRSKGFDYLTKITAVDYGTYVEAVYILYSMQTKQQEVVRVKLDSANKALDTIMRIYPAADWYERELSEMFGIKIKGRRAGRLLLEEWNGKDAPLLKSFVWGKEYRKVDE